MKMILDTDQRKLLKLRSSVLLHSSESDSKSILKAKKKVDKNLMLDMYVDNLRNKKLDTRDIKLLNITGLKEVIEILGAREEFNYKLRLGK
tara:strand:- start:792 stop:1064 length:273 start_codon:yes stop_codon:yes gene_type:complete